MTCYGSVSYSRKVRPSPSQSKEYTRRLGAVAAGFLLASQLCDSGMCPWQVEPAFTAAHPAAPRSPERGRVVRHGRGGMQVVEDADTFLVEEATPETASQIVHKWLGFLKSSVLEALELLATKFRSGLTVFTSRFPAGTASTLGSVAAVAVVRKGQDLDLFLNGGEEWETLHLDFLATTPAVEEATSGESITSGLALLKKLMTCAQKAGRALTVAPLDDRLKERYRQLGFQEDSLVDPSLMFWLPKVKRAFAW
mmetsp:Transcript_21994/g.48863  ORF Transcript_21994/g.48863 Transcript_21994/m.48863 type:complete len:253 (-) Transcript_21994:430-1188(-)